MDNLEAHRTAVDFYSSIGDWDRANAHRLVVVFRTREAGLREKHPEVADQFKVRAEKAEREAAIADETYS